MRLAPTRPPATNKLMSLHACAPSIQLPARLLARPPIRPAARLPAAKEVAGCQEALAEASAPPAEVLEELEEEVSTTCLAAVVFTAAPATAITGTFAASSMAMAWCCSTSGVSVQRWLQC